MTQTPFLKKAKIIGVLIVQHVRIVALDTMINRLKIRRKTFMNGKKVLHRVEIVMLKEPKGKNASNVKNYASKMIIGVYVVMNAKSGIIRNANTLVIKSGLF